MTEFDVTTRQNIDEWLHGDYDDATKDEVRALVKNNPQAAIDAFYTTMSFGTGGLRGMVGVGCNRMNRYTVMQATQGLANYLRKQPHWNGLESTIVIGYDSRHESRFFAEIAAQVLVGNGYAVYLFKALRPTPLISFALRLKECRAGIIITASHNPPNYNGYKVYWDDGGQIVPPQDQGIITEVNKVTDISQVKMGPVASPGIRWLGDEVDEAYLDAVRSLQHYPNDNKEFGNTLKVVYTPLHGTGITLVPKILQDWGFSNIQYVEKQREPDGSFPTVKYPNPEERDAMRLGVETLEAKQRDLLLATDPDADRVGIAIMHQGHVEFLNGNEVAAICLEHICRALIEQDRMPERAVFVKTIVTTELFRAIAKAYGKPCVDVLPGFKWIAAKIHEWENGKDSYQFIFGGEDSYGYLLGSVVRDKDAVIACALICEIALHAKRQGLTLIDLLHEIYRQYGVYREKLLSIDFGESKTGREKMVQAMETLRKNPPKAFMSIPVKKCEDFLNPDQTGLPKSNVLRFVLNDDSWIVVRPSGTEPKVKLYAGVVDHNVIDIPNAIAASDSRLDRLLNAVKNTLTI